MLRQERVWHTREKRKRELVSFAIGCTVAGIADSCCPFALYLLNLLRISDASRIIPPITSATGLISCTRPML